MTEFKDQGSSAEESALQKLNQGVCTDVLKYHPCLIFWYFFIKKKVQEKYLLLKAKVKSSSKQLRNIMHEIKESNINTSGIEVQHVNICFMQKLQNYKIGYPVQAGMTCGSVYFVHTLNHFKSIINQAARLSFKVNAAVALVI
jgi:hypothetical protein